MGADTSLVEHVRASLDDVDAGRVNLPFSLNDIGGLCGWKWRRLVHRLCKPPVTGYLEIGVLNGAITCCALYGNDIRVCAIDNWLDFAAGGHDGSAEKTKATIARYQGANPVLILEGDMFAVAPTGIGGPYQLFYYDAWHTTEATAFAIQHYLPALSNPFILVVDDYNDREYRHIQAGVSEGIRAAGLKILWEHELKSDREGCADTWWNGMYIGVLEKPV